MSTTASCPVLIIGAGPTGLVLALMLRHLGQNVRIVDQEAEPGTTSRALVVQARTLEWYRQIGLDGAVLAAGRRVRAINLWVAGRRRAHVVLDDLGADLSPFPQPVIFAQDDHERLLIARLAQLGVTVERRTALVDVEDDGAQVIARLRHPDGTIEHCASRYLAGCDGARSTTRDQLQVGFPGGTYDHLFYVADVVMGGGPRAAPAADDGVTPPAAGAVHHPGATPADAAPAVAARVGESGSELHVGLDAADFLVVMPLADSGRWRLIGTARRDSTQAMPDLTFADVSQQVMRWMNLDIRTLNWFSTYRVHHRVAGSFRRGRIFLLGDAAHVHSPVGGQGMNTGIGDAVNLAWKLAGVLSGRAPPALLDTYEPERIAFAQRLVRTTDQGFVALTRSSVLARFVRLRVVPLIAPLLFSLRAMRQLLFRTVAQIAISYRGCSELSAGRAGALHGGDRLPFARFADGRDNFRPLRTLDWQLHVYGDPPAGMPGEFRHGAIPLHAFPWDPDLARTGLQPAVIYLVRPDGHIGAIDSHGDGAAIIAYAQHWGLSMAPAAPAAG